MLCEQLALHVEVIVFDFDIYYVGFLALLYRGVLSESRLSLLHFTGPLKLALSRILYNVLDLDDAFAGSEGFVPDLLTVNRCGVPPGTLLLLRYLARLPGKVLWLVVVFGGVGVKHPWIVFVITIILLILNQIELQNNYNVQKIQ